MLVAGVSPIAYEPIDITLAGIEKEVIPAP